MSFQTGTLVNKTILLLDQVMNEQMSTNYIFEACETENLKKEW